MNILIAGNGKMAEELHQFCVEQGIPRDHLDNVYGRNCVLDDPSKTVAVHFGSGRHLGSLIKYCSERGGIPIIQGTTKLTSDYVATSVPLIFAPNLSLPMVRFMTALPDFARQLDMGLPEIFESHQQAKRDVSGTARSLARKLGVEQKDIIHVRNPSIQRHLGIPEEHLDGHAYHTFTFNYQGVRIQVSTEIHGRRTYAEGTVHLARMLCAKPGVLDNIEYTLSEVLQILG